MVTYFQPEEGVIQAVRGGPNHILKLRCHWGDPFTEMLGSSELSWEFQRSWSVVQLNHGTPSSLHWDWWRPSPGLKPQCSWLLGSRGVLFLD